MNCPVCEKEMIEKKFGVKVDVCEQGCKGIWFDQHELRMLDEHDEGLGKALEEALRHPRRNNDDDRGKIRCPKCDIPMQAHKYKRSKEVNLDECYSCGGYFLDSGELKEIRDTYMTDDEVEAYVDQLLKSVPGYTEAVEDLEASKNRNESIQHFTRFLTVNYWRRKFS